VNILIIGNGFDLAHGLKTTYCDFLSFCKELPTGDPEQYNELWKYLDRNLWLSHFILRSISIDYQALLNHSDFTSDRRNWIGILGHSLNSTDKFLLSRILTASSRAQITVYYHSEDSKVDLINKMYALLGEEDAERRVSFAYQHDPEQRFSTHYSLSDFGTAGENGVRKNEDYFKNYFISQYGAIKDIDFTPVLESLIG